MISRTAVWTLTAIDPLDGLPPSDPLVGLLRPGESLKLGFWIDALVDDPTQWSTGSRIRSTASVQFNSNPAAQSLAAVATLDVNPPTTQWTVTSLPGNRYQLNWSVRDDSQSFDVANQGVGETIVLVSHDGVRYRTVARLRGDQSEFTYTENLTESNRDSCYEASMWLEM